MGSSDDSPTDGAVLRCLAVAPRRRVLGLLRDRDPPVEVDDLAAALAAEARAKPPDEVSRDDVRSRVAALRHDHLPRLAAAGLVAWDRANGTVDATDRTALDHPALERVVANPADDWDDVLGSVADDRRRAILSVLRDRGGVMGRTELAARIVARERARGLADSGAASGAGGDVGTVETRGHDAVLSLHHVHLPKLERAGLLAYDPEAGTVSYQGDDTLADDLLGGEGGGADGNGTSAPKFRSAPAPNERG